MNQILRRAGWLGYFIIVGLLSVLPFTLELSTPSPTLMINKAEFKQASYDFTPVTLPHRWQSEGQRQQVGVYKLEFSLASIPKHPLYLFIPNLKRQLHGDINGQGFYDSQARVSWAGPLLQITDLTPIPTDSLRIGKNQLLLQQQAAHPLPSQLSELYVGPLDALEPYFKQRRWINERLLAMSYTAHVLLALGLFAAYSLRREDKLYAWLGITVGLSSFLGAGLLVDVLPSIIHVYPNVFLFGPSIGGASILFALTLVNKKAPIAIQWSVFLAPVLLYLIALTGIISVGEISVLFAMPALVVGFLISALIMAHGAWLKRNTEALLILGPWLLTAIYMLHDLVLSVGDISGISFMSHSVRTLFIIVIIIILMRRLSSSLNTIDRNETVLHTRLAEQEASLDESFAKQRVAIKQSTIETERERLISDLHDGMGGHLVSILALSENPQADKTEVYHVAQKALNDLRLVIYSLDIDGGDLSYALALFRQQIDPVLNNLGIKTRWSMANLPSISETGPSNVLTILRILQEAITNAQKHGSPKQISLVGLPGPENTALIVVENTGGVGFISAGQNGYGLKNMQKRAQAMGGKINLTPLPDGARFELQLPLELLTSSGSH